ncbi:MAG: putative rane protein [Chthoniobacteraceae bacterium]|nr:putative rane protein [Chthoniobacteraceae bacterium]
MVFFGIAFLFPKQRPRITAACAFAFSCAVEFSQIFHAPWIDSIRHTRLGALALGSVFSWPDMAAYAVGVLFALLIGVLSDRVRRSSG